MEDMDLDLEGMEEEEEGVERQNRTFVLLVAVMGGLLLIGIIAFCAWVLIVGRGMFGPQQAASPTSTPPQVATVEQTATAEAAAALQMGVTPGAEESPTPTSTPTPSPTPTSTPARPTRSPTPEVTETKRGTPAAAAEVTPTIGPQRTRTPAATPSTPTTSPETGMGTFTALILAAGLLVLLFVSRRLRTAR